MYKKVIFTLLISLSILTVGCGNKQIVKPTSNNMVTQTNTKPHTQQPNSNNAVITPNNTITTKRSDANEVTYKLTKVIYKIKNITINCPKVTGLSDSNKQNK